MEDVEVLLKYTNIMTRIRAATIAAHSILAEIDTAEVIQCLKDMQELVDGKEKSGVNKDLAQGVQLFRKFTELFDIAEEYIGHDA